MQLSKNQRFIPVSLLLIASFVALISQTMMNTALPVLQKQLHLTLLESQWMTSAYLMSMGVITPISASLYKAFSSRLIFCSLLAVFLLASILAFFAPSYAILLIARILQGACHGLLISFQMTSLVSLYPIEKRGSIIGLSSLVASFGPALGPIIGGYVASYLGWQYLFLIPIPILASILIIALFSFANYNQKEAVNFDFYSLLSCILAFSIIIYSTSLLKQKLSLAIVFLTFGFILLTLFAKRQQKLTIPFLKVSLLKIRSFASFTLAAVLAYALLIGVQQMLPIFAQKEMGMSAANSSWLLLAGTLTYPIGCGVFGKVYDRFGSKYLMLFGSLLMVIALMPLAFLNQHSSLFLVIISFWAFMLANSAIFASAMGKAMSEIKQLDISHGIALNNLSRKTFGAIAVTLMVLIAKSVPNFVLGFRFAIFLAIIFAILIAIIQLSLDDKK